MTWKGESKRHSLASKGIKTGQKMKNLKLKPNQKLDLPMTKSKFRKLFDEAMKTDTIYFSQWDEEKFAPVWTGKEKVKPKIVIRDFSGDDGFDADGVYYQTIPDKEFSDFNKAWAYMKNISNYRVMDVGGSILAEKQRKYK